MFLISSVVISILFYWIVGLLKDVRLAREPLSSYASDDPVSRADDVTAFKRVDPAVFCA